MYAYVYRSGVGETMGPVSTSASLIRRCSVFQWDIWCYITPSPQIHSARRNVHPTRPFTHEQHPRKVQLTTAELDSPTVICNRLVLIIVFSIYIYIMELHICNYACFPGLPQPTCKRAFKNLNVDVQRSSYG